MREALDQVPDNCLIPVRRHDAAFKYLQTWAHLAYGSPQATDRAVASGSGDVPAPVLVAN
ncbi:hypothetical protein [Paenarthrobacter sp. NPDC090522]|uniref:hypothetical protein n=1 Tax=Paenarthrobacter sp. NPDC090522 TaxID=3364383 RepID=UPI0037F67823